jgi:cytochrome P450
MWLRLPPERELSPFEWYRSMRESRPVFYEMATGCWQVFRYDDVFRIASEHGTFSSEGIRRGRTLQEDWEDDDTTEPSIINMDPPRHRQYRDLVTQAFTPRAVAQLADRITVIANELLDHVVANGAMDVLADLAYPLPIIVIAEMLGVPPEDRARFKRWSAAVIADGDDSAPNHRDQHRREAARSAAREMRAYFSTILEERRQHPRRDLISGMLAAEVDGQWLTEAELLGFCILLLVAGNVTTTNLLGNAMLCFDEHPEVIPRLRDEPSLLPSAIEEVLRYRSPAKALVRVAAADTTLGGQQVKRGELVVAWIGSANHDERRFPDPERFDVQRTPNPHLAFGHGIHFCVGAPLARLEGKIALNALFQRLPDLKRAPDVALEPIASAILSGVKRFPVTFSPCSTR